MCFINLVFFGAQSYVKIPYPAKPSAESLVCVLLFLIYVNRLQGGKMSFFGKYLVFRPNCTTFAVEMGDRIYINKVYGRF